MENINKQLQIRIGELIGKDYFKLEFGCKFIFKLAKENLSVKDGLYTVTDSRLPTIHVISEEDGEHHDGFFTIDNFEDNPEEYEILGQEPTLPDVLLAISKSYKLDSMVTIYNNGKTWINGIPYNLEKSIFNQSNETKLAIIKLLE